MTDVLDQLTDIRDDIVAWLAAMPPNAASADLGQVAVEKDNIQTMIQDIALERMDLAMLNLSTQTGSLTTLSGQIKSVGASLANAANMLNLVTQVASVGLEVTQMLTLGGFGTAFRIAR